MHVLVRVMLKSLLQVCPSNVGVGGGRENVKDVIQTTLLHGDGDMFPFVLEGGY